MKSRIISAALALATGLSAAAVTPWIHIYLKNHQFDKEVVFPSMPASEIRDFSFNRHNKQYTGLTLSGLERSYNIDLANVDRWVIGANVPTFRFTTDPDLEEVESKTEYLSGFLAIDGAGIVDDFSGDMLIRGRGNYTWNNCPQKAYRVKFAEKTRLCGFPKKAKNWVLLANYIDPSKMRNQAAFLAAQLCGMPYPNHAMPVDVYFNDNFKGSYMLTEKVGFNNGSVDLTKEDEANSIMFELDTNFDEELRKISSLYRLPINLKDPDAPEDPVQAAAWWDEWIADFTQMEAAVQSGKGIGDYIDYGSLARYLLCFNLGCNQELNHPKSVYLYKTRGGKYNFGPIWDFDWAFGFQPKYSTEIGEPLTKDQIAEKLKAIHQYIEENGIQPYTAIQFDNKTILWYGEDDFIYIDYSVNTFRRWPDDAHEFEPTYRNFLFGNGDNNNNADGMGSGGEFFMSIIMDNPEFMAEYKKVWAEFQSRLPEFWEKFDAYAKSLKPSATRNMLKWGLVSNNIYDPEFREQEAGRPDDMVAVLRSWIEKRLEFMADPEKNYGLYDPATTYVRGTANVKAEY